MTAPAHNILPAVTDAPQRPWYRERLFWFLLLAGVVIFLPRLTTLTIRGEESRRAVIAREMLESGDWVVPRTQGLVRLSRPPLQNWLIALTAIAVGDLNGWAIRLPGLLCTLCTMALVYWYARLRLQSAVAFIAGLAYATMLQVLELGRSGETEPVFTLMIGAALMLWHGGRLAGWRPEVYWAVGALFGACATLTKGLQAPLYFFASTWAYLILSGHWRALLSRGHLAGLLTFTGVVGLWQVPFVAQMGLENGWLIYFSNVAKRFHDDRWSTFVTHLLTYPISVVVGCLAPWSLFYLAFLNRDLRSQLGARRDMLLFLATATAICFPSVWLPPEARPRYFMPLFPCFAVAVGIAVELMLVCPNASAVRLWTFFRRAGTGVMLAAAAVLGVWSILGVGTTPPPLGPTLIYSAVVTGLAILMWRLPMSLTAQPLTRAVGLMAAFLAVTYTGPMMNHQVLRSENLPGAVAELRSQLPDDARLVSFDRIHHVFLHYFETQVPMLPWPKTAEELPADVEYFCVHVGGKETPQLPFAWEPVASLSVDRNHHATPNERILVGKVGKMAAGAVRPVSHVAQGVESGRPERLAD